MSEPDESNTFNPKLVSLGLLVPEPNLSLPYWLLEAQWHCSWGPQAWRLFLAWECSFQWYFPCSVFSLSAFLPRTASRTPPLTPCEAGTSPGEGVAGSDVPSLWRGQISDSSASLLWHLFLSLNLDDTFSLNLCPAVPPLFTMDGRNQWAIGNNSLNYFILSWILMSACTYMCTKCM